MDLKQLSFHVGSCLHVAGDYIDFSKKTKTGDIYFRVHDHYKPTSGDLIKITKGNSGDGHDFVYLTGPKIGIEEHLGNCSYAYYPSIEMLATLDEANCKPIDAISGKKKRFILNDH